MATYIIIGQKKKSYDIETAAGKKVVISQITRAKNNADSSALTEIKAQLTEHKQSATAELLLKKVEAILKSIKEKSPINILIGKNEYDLENKTHCKEILRKIQAYTKKNDAKKS